MDGQNSMDTDKKGLNFKKDSNKIVPDSTKSQRRKGREGEAGKDGKEGQTGEVGANGV